MSCVEDSELIKACMIGDVEMLKLMTLSHDDVCIGIFIACKNNQINVIKYLSEEYDCTQFYALLSYNACISGHLEIVEYLSEKGVINYNNEFEIACEFGRLNIVKYFIEVYKVRDYYDGFYIACKKGQLDVVKYLTEFYTSLPLRIDYKINQIIACKQYDVVKFLMQKHQFLHQYINLDYIPTLLNAGFSTKLFWLKEVVNKFVKERDLLNETIKKDLLTNTTVCENAIDIICSYTPYLESYEH